MSGRARDRNGSGRMIDVAAWIVAIAIDRLANEPHDTIQELRRPYYYRGAFGLLEHLTARGLAVNVARLRRRGEHAHAEALALASSQAAGRRRPEINGPGTDHLSQ